ncbi:hypothetical protein [Polaromonas sp.]|uniref:hypothetical protein n=1 Tax=Polaromonas sp. TaxID=1869339 RepID=UPI0017EE0848|nr:hypothetical protein [Polaromonas sp.]NML86289.1 hypothetical protein [Polaromonas sp.]
MPPKSAASPDRAALGGQRGAVNVAVAQGCAHHRSPVLASFEHGGGKAGRACACACACAFCHVVRVSIQIAHCLGYLVVADLHDLLQRPQP